MKVLRLVLIAVLGIVYVSGSSIVGENQEKRLIQTSEDQPATWMTEDEIFELIERNQGFMDITDFDYSNPISHGQGALGLPEGIRFNTKVNEVIGKWDDTAASDFVKMFSDYHNRYYTTQTGRDSQLKLLELVNKALEGYGGEFTVEEVDHGYLQKSIVARLTGADAELKSEVVIIGAHLDSVSSGAAGKAPGADDNGSGTVVTLFTLDAIVKTGVIMKKTVEFHFYAAEEIGLRGSQAIAQDYSKRNVSVIGYQVEGILDISIYTDYANEQLLVFLRKVADAYLEYGWRDNYCGYGCSDHASWDRNGFPAVFAGEPVDSPYMHTVQDTFENMDMNLVKEFFKLAAGYAVEVGEPVSP